MGMAEALRTLGKNEQAIEYYQRYLDVLPNGSEAAVARNSIERLKK
jgi:regulator of sirC expression with transglutaminase-like and TPR domain